jgi:hypothetical protein
MVEPIPSTHPKITEWLPEVLKSVPSDVLERYKSQTCVNGDVSYKIKQLLSAMTNDHPHSDAIPRSVHVINQCLFIREALGIGSILSDSYFPPGLMDMLESFSCLSVVGDDNKGNTIIYYNLTAFSPSDYSNCWERGSRDIPEAIRSASQKFPEFNDPAVVNYCSLWYVRMMEWIHLHRFESFKKGKATEPRVVMILNVGSVGISTLTSELRQFLKGIKILGNCLYPEIADYIFAANVPWIADRFWPLVRKVLHPATAVKVNLYDSTRTKKFIKDIISHDELPKCFGGTYNPERKFCAHGRSVGESELSTCSTTSNSSSPSLTSSLSLQQDHRKKLVYESDGYASCGSTLD